MEDFEEVEAFEEKSRSQKKREVQAIQKLGERLVSLSVDQLKRISMPEELKEAVVHAKAIKSFGAKKRQLQHIGSMMRDIDIDPVTEAFEQLASGNVLSNKIFHQVESFRDQLIAGNDSIIEEIVAINPEADRQRIRQLVRNAKKENEKNKPPKSSRTLFKYLSDLYGSKQ